MTLKTGDLVDLVDRMLEIDSYKSKMGNDNEIVVIAFSVNGEQPAKDLVNFIEKGYDFVLDADNTTSEQEDGLFRVYVELERNDQVPSEIMEIIDGVSKLTDKKDFKFRYYKNFKSFNLDIENLTKQVPLDPDSYESIMKESYITNFKNFFNKSYLEEISLNENDELYIKKAYADPLAFQVKTVGPKDKVLENIKETINVNDFAEVIFFTKYIGDYNVTKFGKKTLTFENQDHLLVVERIYG